METLTAPMARKPVTDPPVTTPFGDRLRAARKARGLSMRELADAASTPDAKLSHATVSLIESGRQTAIDAETAVRIGRALGVTVEWLMTGEPPPA